MIYTAQQLKEWTDTKFKATTDIMYGVKEDCTAVQYGKQIPSRPELSWGLKRFKAAYLVLIGRYDALDWDN